MPRTPAEIVERAPDVSLIGHITKETEKIDGVERGFIGGPAYFSSLALKRLGTSVAVTTKLAEEDLLILNELREENIEIYLGDSNRTSSFGTIYGKNLDERYLKVRSVATPFGLTDIKILPKKFFYLGPLTTKDFDISMLEELSKKSGIVLDVQGLTREVRGDKIEFVDWPEKEEGLGDVDILKADKCEAEILTHKEDIWDCAEDLSSYGSREILLTSRNGVFVYAEGERYFSPFTIKEVKGRVGRGDTCTAAYAHCRVKQLPPGFACKFAAAATSLKLSYEGPFKDSEEKVIELMNSYRMGTANQSRMIYNLDLSRAR